MSIMQTSCEIPAENTGTVLYLESSICIFQEFFLILTKFSFWEEDWALGYDSIKFWDFPDIS